MTVIRERMYVYRDDPQVCCVSVRTNSFSKDSLADLERLVFLAEGELGIELDREQVRAVKYNANHWGIEFNTSGLAFPDMYPLVDILPEIK